MEKYRWNKIWAVSLMVIGLATVGMTGAQIAAGMGAQGIPDVLIRVCGIADLAALPFLGFSTVKKLQNWK